MKRIDAYKEAARRLGDTPEEVERKFAKVIIGGALPANAYDELPCWRRGKFYSTPDWRFSRRAGEYEKSIFRGSNGSDTTEKTRSELIMSETKQLLLACPRCRRSGLSPDTLRSHSCRDNGWNPLPAEVVDKAIRDAQKEADSMDKPWGYDVKITTHDGQVYTKKKQGTLSAVNRWAILQRCHKSHEIVNTYTREQWIRVYGDGRERM